MNKNPVSASKMVVLDVGRQKRKAINDLKQGVGPLYEEVEEARAAAEQQGKDDKEVLPVVIVYRKADRKRRGLVRDILSRL